MNPSFKEKIKPFIQNGLDYRLSLKKICSFCKKKQFYCYFEKLKMGFDGHRNKCIGCRKIEKEVRDPGRKFSRAREKARYDNMSFREKKAHIKKKSEANLKKFKNNPEALIKRRAYGKTDRGIFTRYKQDSTRRYRKYSFKLSFDYFTKLINSSCHYCNTFPSRGVDRFNNSLGYTIKNCVPCCSRCNEIKLDFSIKETLIHIKKILDFYKN